MGNSIAVSKNTLDIRRMFPILRSLGDRAQPGQTKFKKNDLPTCFGARLLIVLITVERRVGARVVNGGGL